MKTSTKDRIKNALDILFLVSVTTAPVSVIVGAYFEIAPIVVVGFFLPIILSPFTVGVN